MGPVAIVARHLGAYTDLLSSVATEARRNVKRRASWLAAALCGWLASRAGASSPHRARLMSELRLDRQILADWTQRQ